MNEVTQDAGPTVVAAPMGERALLWLGFPVLGAAAGWAVKALAGWATTLAWVPFQGPLRLVASLADPQATIGAVVVGAVAGLVVAYIARQETLQVTVSDDELTLARGKKTRSIAGESVDGVFVDAKRLVVLDAETRELAREECDLGTQRLQQAFTAHGYSWSDTDPHEDDFRPWVEESPDLSSSAHALLKARRRALDKDKKDDARELRDELAKLGVVVREREKRQQWRQVGESGIAR